VEWGPWVSQGVRARGSRRRAAWDQIDYGRDEVETLEELKDLRRGRRRRGESGSMGGGPDVYKN
jgi:hypothetical protein